jgi:hypothetical protein
MKKKSLKNTIQVIKIKINPKIFKLNKIIDFCLKFITI